MHAVAIQLAPIIGAEKSKVPFYIAGGALVVWAVFLSLGAGHAQTGFPRQRDGRAGGDRDHRRAGAGGRVDGRGDVGHARQGGVPGERPGSGGRTRGNERQVMDPQR